MIENGIDIEGYKKEEVALPIPEDVFVVGMIDTITGPEKMKEFL